MTFLLAIVASGQKASVKDGPLGDFILIQEESAKGRRPRGLDDKGGGGGKGSGKGGKGKGSGGGKGGRAVGCSTPAPRGPTCKFNHPPPCYRDADWAGPIPQYVIDNKERFARLLIDRNVVAERLFKEGLRSSAKAVPLKGPTGKDEMVAVLEEDDPQLDECDDCEDGLWQAQQLNDSLQVLEVQPGQIVAGERMPDRLRQLRDLSLCTGKASDEQAYHDAFRLWCPQHSEDHTSAGSSVVAVLDEAAPPPSGANAPRNAATHESEVLQLRAQLKLMAEKVAAIDAASSDKVGNDNAVVADAPMPVTDKLTRAQGAVLSMNGSTVSIADLRAAATVDIVAEGADPVGSFMLRCVRYALATMTVMIALTVGLGLYAGAKHAFPPSVTSSDSVAQRECSGRRLACIGAQFVDTVYTMVGAAAGLLEVASRSSDACMAAAFAIGGAMYAMSIYGWTDVAVAHVQAFVGKLHAAVHNGWKFTVFICMIYLMVAGGDGASCDDLIAYNELVRAHAGSEWFMFHADVASRISELWSNTMLMPAVHSLDELVLLAEADGRDPTNTVVIDTGARRSVIRDPKCFNKATCRPAPFKVRGVLGASGQPDFMGNATIYMPVSDTATGAPVLVEAVELIDAVCIPLCPHDIVAVGPLLWGGASLWLAPGEQVSWLRFGSGAYARLYNRAIVFADACAPKGTSTVAVASDAPRPFVPPQIVAGSGGRKEAFYMTAAPMTVPRILTVPRDRTEDSAAHGEISACR